ncbi:MAG: hypothetical protein Rubg2KO_22000 [Rubricoccaceae bacterium]
MPRLAVVATALFLASCSSPAKTLQAQTQALADTLREAPAFTAVVTDATAAFVLPVPDRTEWIWSAGETPNNAPEYHWEIGVTNEGTDYQFGFWKFKHPSLSPTRGSLGDLIEAGQESLWRANPGGGSSAVMSAGVRVVPLRPGLVLVTIEGGENVAQVFSSRPREASIVIASLGEPQTERTVEITYENVPE